MSVIFIGDKLTSAVNITVLCYLHLELKETLNFSYKVMKKESIYGCFT
jgi:hypothetical protein